MVVPKKISLEEKEILVEWSDGHKSIYSNKNMRDACPCAMRAGESLPLGGRIMIPLRPAVPDDTKAISYSMIGLYAIAFVWSDGHDSGIYAYDYLLSLCGCESCLKLKGC